MGGRRLRILELSTEEQVQRWFIDPLAAYLRQKGHQVIQKSGFARTISLRDLWSVMKVWWWLTRWHIDLLHVQTAKAGAIGRLAAWMAGTVRVVYTMHDVPFHDGLPRWKKRLYRWIERRLAPLCHAVTVDSPAVKNRALEVLPDRKITVIPVGVDTTRFQPRVKPLMLGMVARLVPGKGTETFLGLIHTLQAMQQPCFGLLVGDGPLDPLLQRDAQQWNIGIWFAGAQGDVRPWLAAMDIFLFPSEHEGLPVAVLEAMSMGLPVMVSDLPAFDGLVRHGETGLRVQPGDWIQAISDLMAAPARRWMLGHAARVHARTYYEQAASHRAYEHVLTGVV